MKSAKKIKNYFKYKPGYIKVALGIVILLIILYSGLLYIQDMNNIGLVNAIIQDKPIKLKKITYIIDLIEMLLTIFASMLISSVITTMLVGKKEKDEIYSEAVEDLIMGSDVKMEISEKGSVYQSDFFKELQTKKLPKDMIETAIKELSISNIPYYYEKCDMEINCRISKNGKNLIKEIKKEITIYSFDNTYVYSAEEKEDMFVLAAMNSIPKIKEPIKVLELQVSLPGKKLKKCNEESYMIDKKKTESDLTRKQGYAETNTVYLKETLKLSSTKPTKIKIIYQTTVSLSDLDYVFRLPCACHFLEVNFHLKDMTDYRLCGYAFGFLDDASSTLNFDSDDEMVFSFNKWVFRYDGVCISIKEK